MLEPVADLIFAVVTRLATLFGGSVGLAIIAVTVALRLALLPLTSRIARRALEQRLILERLKPELVRLQELYTDDPARLASEMRDLYRQNGVQFLSVLSVIGMLVQVPIFGGFFAAIRRGLGAGVRFLAIPNLGVPSFFMALVVAAFAYAGVVLTGTDQSSTFMIALPVAIMFVVAWQASAAMALYWATSSAVGLAQQVWIQRSIARRAISPRPE